MSVVTVPLLEDLQGPWGALQIRLVGPGAPAAGAMTASDLYPFMSIADLKRLIWTQQAGDPRWAPERVFIGVRSADGATLRPLEFWWPGADNPALPDPLVPANQRPSPLLVDEAGNRKPVSPVLTAGLLVESALRPDEIVEAISLAAFAGAGTVASPSPTLFAGFFQLYWPWLTVPTQVADAAATTATATDREALAATIPYIEDRIGRISVVQRALRARVGGSKATMISLVRMRWILPMPAERPQSLEKTFYALPASETIPFLRYYPVTGSPLLKLGLGPDGAPLITDPRILESYINRPAPNIKSAVVVARIPIVSSHVERGAAFLLHLFEDGTTDITLEVPQHGATYIAAVATDAERQLRGVLAAIGYPPETVPLLRELHATYRWTHPDPRRAQPLSAAKLQQRAAALTPFLDPVPAVPGETALAVFRWRAVSNYESEAAQFAFITQMVLRGGGVQEGADARAAYVRELSERFGMTPEAAESTLERWLENRAEAVAPGPGTAGVAAVARRATGASVAVSGTHPEYSLELQDVDSPAELQRLLSIVAVLLGAASTELAIAPPAPEVAAAAAAVAVAEEVVEETVAATADEDIGELDPAMAALMADLGYDMDAGVGGDAEEMVEVPALAIVEMGAAAPAIATAPPPPPLDVDAAIAALGDIPCGGSPWAPGEPALKLKDDWYMDRLKREDKVLFGYSSTTTGRVKGFSKTCQRRDGRQPNVLTQNEYIRVRHCYDDRVRFVLLPPSKPSDLPQDSTWKPTGARSDDYYMRDPESGRPMWTVYGYVNKTNPAKRTYLMCPELWCDRDNLPLLREEFAGTEGRGFSKPANSCPFCGGRAIATLEAPQPGESVIVRTPKESTGKYHSFIGTVTRTKHPAGYELPCCDTTPRLLKKYMKKAYDGNLKYDGQELLDDGEEGAGAGAGAGAAAAAADDVLPEPEPGMPEATGVTADERTVGYVAKLGSMTTQYILSSDKSLEAGKFGLLPPLLDAFFGQNSQRAVEMRGIRPTFAEGATLFVRVGVDVQLQAPGRNLFAGLAPLLGKDSAEQVQRAILERPLVRAFESANYGTLLQEFAARSQLTEAEINGSLAAFAATAGATLNDASRPHLLRLYRAWNAYLNYIRSVRQPKQLRHIEHILAQPGAVTPRGLLLITLEQHSDRIEVVCPAFGVPPASAFAEVPVAFIWHDRRDDTWEPLVLYNGTKQAVLLFSERATEVPPALRANVSRWIRTWRAGCGRPIPSPHVWTPDRDTAGLPRLSSLIVDSKTQALVRDRSNRVAGVLSAAAADQPPLFVPCLDDGNLALTLPRVYEATMIPPAPLAAYLAGYATLATSYPALRPAQLLTRITETSATTIVGIQLAIGTMIPVAPETFKTDTAPLPAQQMDAFPWERDALILRAPDAPPSQLVALEESTASVEEQLAEAYQHVRLSFSFLLPRQPALLANIQGLIQKGLPLYEKRKRMDILLEPIIRTMILPEETTDRRALSLLRVDCLALDGDEAGCAAAGACRWSGGRCLIHAPVRTGSGTNAIRVMTARLTDELLRYAARRRELFEQDVAEIREPRGVVRVGDELFLATRQNEGAAAVMDRLGLTGAAPMTFPEELLRFEGAEAEAPAAVGETEEEAELDIMGEQPPLPSEWTALGFQVASPAPNVGNPAALAFAEATRKSIPEWETLIQQRRAQLKLPGPTERPLQWSTQDWYVVGTILLSNIIFVNRTRSGTIRISRWIAPSPTAAPSSDLWIMVWGPQQLTVYRRKFQAIKVRQDFRFERSILPKEVEDALEVASPISDADAQGYVETVAAAAAAPAPLLAEEDGGGVPETKSDS